MLLWLCVWGSSTALMPRPACPSSFCAVSPEIYGTNRDVFYPLPLYHIAMGAHKTPLVPWSFSDSLVKSASGQILAAASLRGSVICLSLWAGRRDTRSSFPRLCSQELTHKTMSTPSLPPPNYSEEVTRYFAKVRTDFLPTLF